MTHRLTTRPSPPPRRTTTARARSVHAAARTTNVRPAIALLALLASGCVPSFDRCQIPDTPGCPALDAGERDAETPDDAGPLERCLPSAPGSILFATDFDDVTLDRFTLQGDATADWAIAASQLEQRDASARDASAILADIVAADVRVVARMTRIEGGSGGAMELTARASGDVSYHCNWEPGSGDFEVQREGQAVPLSAERIDLASIPGYTPDRPVTMELEVVGSRIACCLREIPGASLTLFDDMLTGGSPGVRTFTLAASFDDLTVYEAR